MSWALALILLLQIDSPAAAPPPSAASPSGEMSGLKGADLDLLNSVRVIAAKVEESRGQRFDRPPLAVRVHEDMRRVASEIRSTTVIPPERLAARGRAWADVGLGEPAVPERLLRILAEDLGDIGFDPTGNRLLVAPDRLSADDFEVSDDPESSAVLMMTGVRPDEPLVSHMLMHVRQRERLGRDILRPSTDALLASAAWAEGEANLVAIRYLFEGMGLSNDILEHRLDPGAVLEGELLPATPEDLSATESNLVDFVYLEGFDRVVAEFREGGWSAVDRAIAERTSTRQMLHPGRTAPVEDFPASPEPPVEGLRLVDEDTLGEQAIVVLVSLGTGKDNLGLIAGDGWAGGRLYRWETDGASDGVTEWVTRWDSNQAAADFVYGFERALAVRYPGSEPTEAGEGWRRFDATDRDVLIESNQTTVRVLVAEESWAGSLDLETAP